MADPFKELANDIFDELKAQGTWVNKHLDRELTPADIHDAVLTVTDDPEGANCKALLARHFARQELSEGFYDID